MLSLFSLPVTDERNATPPIGGQSKEKDKWKSGANYAFFATFAMIVLHTLHFVHRVVPLCYPPDTSPENSSNDNKNNMMDCCSEYFYQQDSTESLSMMLRQSLSLIDKRWMLMNSYVYVM